MLLPFFLSVSAVLFRLGTPQVIPVPNSIVPQPSSLAISYPGNPARPIDVPEDFQVEILKYYEEPRLSKDRFLDATWDFALYMAKNFQPDAPITEKRWIRLQWPDITIRTGIVEEDDPPQQARFIIWALPIMFRTFSPFSSEDKPDEVMMMTAQLFFQGQRVGWIAITDSDLDQRLIIHNDDGTINLGGRKPGYSIPASPAVASSTAVAMPSTLPPPQSSFSYEWYDREPPLSSGFIMRGRTMTLVQELDYTDESTARKHPEWDLKELVIENRLNKVRVYLAMHCFLVYAISASLDRAVEQNVRVFGAGGQDNGIFVDFQNKVTTNAHTNYRLAIKMLEILAKYMRKSQKYASIDSEMVQISATGKQELMYAFLGTFGRYKTPT